MWWPGKRLTQFQNPPDNVPNKYQESSNSTEQGTGKTSAILGSIPINVFMTD